MQELLVVSSSFVECPIIICNLSVSKTYIIYVFTFGLKTKIVSWAFLFIFKGNFSADSTVSVVCNVSWGHF